MILVRIVLSGYCMLIDCIAFQSVHCTGVQSTILLIFFEGTLRFEELYLGASGVRERFVLVLITVRKTIAVEPALRRGSRRFSGAYSVR